MNTNYLENNHITLVGKVTKEKLFSHEIYGERFYIFNIDVPRLSDSIDIIPITVSERLLTSECDIELGKTVEVDGQFRSYNGYENEKSKLILTVFAKDLKIKDIVVDTVSDTETEPTEQQTVEQNSSNDVTLIGYICKKPIYRKTPFGREIADVLLAVNRAYNKSDYIPCIAWGRNARFCENLEVGKQVKVKGRVQSRTYEKKHEDGTVTTKVAYEVSVSGMEILEENGDANTASETEASEAI